MYASFNMMFDEVAWNEKNFYINLFWKAKKERGTWVKSAPKTSLLRHQIQFCGSETTPCLSSQHANLARWRPWEPLTREGSFPGYYQTSTIFYNIITHYSYQLWQYSMSTTTPSFSHSFYQESLDKTMKTGLESPFPCSSAAEPLSWEVTVSKDSSKVNLTGPPQGAPPRAPAFSRWAIFTWVPSH